ncbi:RHS repeat domain-containing protein [Sorangium sp. So ce1024]|uniref:RHS repeat domain-containing protein n=1 Tax=Sorangium sp. So ce1024 TaxID=3133327 RepID=UPI003F06BB08
MERLPIGDREALEIGLVLLDGTRVVMTYDAFGRRVRKEVTSTAVVGWPRAVDFVWDGDVLAADIDSERGVRTFVHAPGTFVPLLQQQDGRALTYVNDHLGTPRELLDPRGLVAWSAAHSAWGKVADVWRDPISELNHRTGVESPFRLLGQYADEETGLCYTRFRYFDPEIGGWCSPDPLRIAGGLNLFAFDGAPTVDVDPLGLSCIPTLKVPAGSDNIGRDMNREALEHLVAARSNGATAAEMADMYQGMVKQLHGAASQHGQSWGAARMDCRDGSVAFKGEGGGRELVIAPDRNIHVGPPGLINTDPRQITFDRSTSPARLLMAPPNFPGPPGTRTS